MSTAADAHDTAEDYFKDENFAAAAPWYDKAVAAAPSNARYLANRCNNHLKLGAFDCALRDADLALTLDPHNARALHRRAMALFMLDRFKEAAAAFTAAKDAGFEGDVNLWQRKCAAEMERLAAGPVAPVQGAGAGAAAQPIVHKIEALPTPAQEKKAAAAAAAPAAPAAPLNLAQKTREQFYQIADEVTLTLLAKNVKSEQVHISLDAATATLHARIAFPADGSEFSRSWNLFARVVDAPPSIHITPYKIEITLKKCVPLSWSSLERKEGAVLPAETAASVVAADGSVVVPRANVIREDINYAAYPTSSKTLKNWSEVEAEAKRAEEEEKPEGEAALQKLFQSIYGGADEDTRRAMVKSFQTSGGTVLSTNWKEVKEKNYEKEREAPKGQEIKDWNARDRS